MREQVDINVCFWLFPCYQQSISFIFLILNKVKLLSHVQLFATPWIVAYQVSPSMGSSRQEYWSGLPFPSPGILILKYTLNHVLLLLTVFFFFLSTLLIDILQGFSHVFFTLLYSFHRRAHLLQWFLCGDTQSYSSVFPSC